MICPRCGAATWNYNTVAGTRMCVNGHQTDLDGNDIPFTPTYTQATVPVAVAPPPPAPVTVKGLRARTAALMIVVAVAAAQVVERLVA